MTLTCRFIIKKDYYNYIYMYIDNYSKIIIKIEYLIHKLIINKVGSIIVIILSSSLRIVQKMTHRLH